MAKYSQSTDTFSDFAVFEDRLPPFSIPSALSVGWQALKRYYWKIVAVGVILMVVSSIVSGICSIAKYATVGLDGDAGAAEFLYQGLNFLNAFLVGIPLSAGFLYVGLLAVRWQSPGVGKVFSGFGRYWLLVRTGLLQSLLWIGPAVLVGLGVFVGWLFDTDSPPLQPPIQGGWVIGGAVAVLPAGALALWLMTRLSFTYLVIMDPVSTVSTAREVVRASWNMTRPYAWRLAGVLVTVYLLYGLSLCCCLFPAVFLGIPLLCVVPPAAYEMIRQAEGRSVIANGESEATDGPTDSPRSDE
jgi:hypothetical protein